MSFGHFTIDEGLDPLTGVRTQYHFQGDQVVCQKTYDAEPYLKRAAEMRALNEAMGKGWGEGRHVGVIPPWALPDIEAIACPKEREKATKAFFRANPAFLAYPAFIQ